MARVGFLTAWPLRESDFRAAAQDSQGESLEKARGLCWASLRSHLVFLPPHWIDRRGHKPAHWQERIDLVSSSVELSRNLQPCFKAITSYQIE